MTQLEFRDHRAVIIGAGPAGLAAAMTLAKEKYPLEIHEKQLAVGGLAKTYRFQEEEYTFLTDNGPHRFFSKNPKLYQFIESLLDERWIRVERCTRQYIDGKFYHYPIRIRQALGQIGIRRASRMMLDYVQARIQYGVVRRPIRSFEDYIVAHFGKSLGHFNMINYTEKIWGIPASQIHPDWAIQRIRGLNFLSAARNALRTAVSQKDVDSPKSLADSFYYPVTGTGLIYETIEEKLRRQNVPVYLESWPVRIEHDQNRISRVHFSRQGETYVVEPEHLIESIPINAFVQLLDPPPPLPVQQAAANLRFRSQIYLFLTLDKESVTPDQWIYFPEKRIPFGRVSEMKNFSPHMSPPGKTSLFVEYFCFEGDRIWNLDAKTLFEESYPFFQELGFFSRREVRNIYHARLENVYPIYDLEYEKHLSIIKGYLDRFQNLFYIGRPGRFRYNNQDHSLEMGMAAARSILDGRRLKIETIGSEDEYLEAGEIPTPARGRL